MNRNNINIFEFPSNLGLKRKESDREPGVKLLPSWLKKQGFHERIKPEQLFVLNPPEYSMDLDEESGVRNADDIIGYATQQAELFFKHLEADSFQIVLGGDCSILIGISIALKQKGKYGLFFLDGHTDFMLPDLSQTGGAAGMDLAIVTGYGHNKLTDILNLEPYFEEENIWCVGNREYYPDYVKQIMDSDIHYVDLKTLRKKGVEDCATRFLEMVQQNNLDGFFIHLDVDVLNDGIMPAVDSRNKDGLEYFEFVNLLGILLSSYKVIGIEITILDPTLDEGGKCTKEFISNFVHTLDMGKASVSNQI